MMKIIPTCVLLLISFYLSCQEKITDFKSNKFGFNIDSGIASINFFDTFQQEIIIAPNKNLYRIIDNKYELITEDSIYQSEDPDFYFPNTKVIDHKLHFVVMKNNTYTIYNYNQKSVNKVISFSNDTSLIDYVLTPDYLYTMHYYQVVKMYRYELVSGQKVEIDQSGEQFYKWMTPYGNNIIVHSAYNNIFTLKDSKLTPFEKNSSIHFFEWQGEKCFSTKTGVFLFRQDSIIAHPYLMEPGRYETNLDKTILINETFDYKVSIITKTNTLQINQDGMAYANPSNENNFVLINKVDSSYIAKYICIPNGTVKMLPVLDDYYIDFLISTQKENLIFTSRFNSTLGRQWKIYTIDLDFTLDSLKLFSTSDDFKINYVKNQKLNGKEVITCLGFGRSFKVLDKDYKPIEFDLLCSIYNIKTIVMNDQLYVLGKAQTNYTQLFRFELNDIINSNIDFESKKLSLFPNPTTQSIAIDAENNGDYHIFNATGLLVKSGQIYQGSNKIDVYDLPTGFYIFQTNRGSVGFVKI